MPTIGAACPTFAAAGGQDRVEGGSRSDRPELSLTYARLSPKLSFHGKQRIRRQRMVCLVSVGQWRLSWARTVFEPYA